MKITFDLDTEHNGIHMLLVGQWQDLAAYYQGDNGTSWIYNAGTRGWSNAGSYDEFIRRFSTGFYRGELTDKTVPNRE